MIIYIFFHHTFFCLNVETYSEHEERWGYFKFPDFPSYLYVSNTWGTKYTFLEKALFVCDPSFVSSDLGAEWLYGFA